jgi:hypothetical protein
MVIIVSKKANEPVYVGDSCRENPQEEVYALPWIHSSEALIENLKTNGVRPNRVIPCEPNKKEIPDCETHDFYDRLEDDAFGNLALSMKHGSPALNEAMDTPCCNGFYGSVISPVWQPGATVILRCKRVQEMFPVEPLSAKLYAMTTVPVSLKNTDQFRKLTGCEDETVPVLAASDFIPKIVTFMRFNKLYNGRDYVFSIDPSKYNGPRPLVLRYNRAYKVV